MNFSRKYSIRKKWSSSISLYLLYLPTISVIFYFSSLKLRYFGDFIQNIEYYLLLFYFLFCPFAISLYFKISTSVAAPKGRYKQK